MNTLIDVEEHLEMDSQVQVNETDTNILVQRGLSHEEITGNAGPVIKTGGANTGD